MDPINPELISDRGGKAPPPTPDENALALWEAREWDAQPKEDVVVLYGDILRRRCKVALEERNTLWATQRILASGDLTDDETEKVMDEAVMLREWVITHWPQVRDDILRSLWEGASVCRFSTTYELTFSPLLPKTVVTKVAVSVVQR